MGDNIPNLAGRSINKIVQCALILIQCILEVVLERSCTMSIKPKFELMVLCAILLIESATLSDLTEILRPYIQTHKVI